MSAPARPGHSDASQTQPGEGTRRLARFGAAERLLHRLSLFGALALIAAIVFGTLPLHPF